MQFKKQAKKELLCVFNAKHIIVSNHTIIDFMFKHHNHAV